MMKKMIALVLIAMLLLTACQNHGGQTAAVDATEPTATYDWMAGESPVTPQRMGLKRAGTNNTDYAIAPNGVYFIYDLGHSTEYSFDPSFVLYSDYGSDTVIKLCGRADCDHNNADCNAFSGTKSFNRLRPNMNICLATVIIWAKSMPMQRNCSL